jgi:hypothetical protein
MNITALVAMVDRHVAEGERHISGQRALIRRLHHAGRDTTLAESVLDTLEQSQQLHVEHRDRLRTDETATKRQ